jgi:hypothetical protein
MRRWLPTGLVAAALAAAAPLVAQDAGGDTKVWHLEGLRSGFCVQFLLAPTSEALTDLPAGVRPIPASEVGDLHVSLKGVVDGQPEFAAWSPSRLCLNIVDAIRTDAFTLADRSGKHPQLFATWTVTAAAPGGAAGEIVLDLFANSDRLIRSARLAGHTVREARLTVGKVPAEDENGTPSTEDRIQIKVGKTIVTWDGHLAGDSTAAASPIEILWTISAQRAGTGAGKLMLAPVYMQGMVGSLKVDGKDAFAKALRASPTRFAGPAYRGGEGTVSFSR